MTARGSGLTRVLFLAFGTSCAVACTAERARTAAAPADLAIHDVSVVDVETGRVVPSRTVVVRGGRIAEVRPSATADRTLAAARVVDGAGRFLIPGLWDMHVHAARGGRAPRFWPMFVAHGVTGIRETGTFLDSALHWREAARRPGSGAPRIVWTGPMLDGDPPAYGYGRAVRTPDEARAVVREMRERGFDYLKIYNGLSREAFLAIADEARRVGIPIAGEVPDAVAPAEAASAGMRSFEHLWNLFEHCAPGANALRDSLAVLDRRDAPEAERRPVRERQYRSWLAGADSACVNALVRDIRGAGTWQVPTIAINRSYSFPDSTYAGDARRRLVPADILAGWDTLRGELLEEYGELGLRAWKARYAAESDLLRRLAAAGVGILAGTDASDEPFIYAGASIHDELRLLVEAGLTPLQALQSATIGPARFLGAADSLGTVAPGKLADLVLLDANPLEDVRNTARIRAVARGGRLLDRAALDSMLARVEREVAAPGTASQSTRSGLTPPPAR